MEDKLEKHHFLLFPLIQNLIDNNDTDVYAPIASCLQIIQMHNSLDNITCSELVKQSLQTKKIN